MQSSNYERAKKMILNDKYNAVRIQFLSDFTELAKRYFEIEAIKVETYNDSDLQVVITMSVKKVKQIRLVMA